MEPVLYGRDEPLSALRGALDDALAGRGRLALVSGEAGIGKSALAAVLARDAEARGAAVTWGRAWEFADAPPLFPMRPCLRALGVEAAGGHDEFDLWERVLASLARGGPSVWILEDLHAADLATLDLLTFLAQPLRAMRALVVATHRARDPRIDARMQQRFVRMARDGLDLPLAPLSAADVGTLTADTLGRAVPPRELARLVELTGGNPLFVVECARAFRAAGGVEGTLGTLPPTVRQLALDRVALLPEATRRALACGAVLGRELAAATVARMNATLPARIIDDLLPALRAGLVEELRPGDFRFAHTLVRDAIEDATPPRERAELHARAEHALAALGERADVLVERARHAIEALPAATTEPEHALELAARARALLEGEGAFDRAFELASREAAARDAGLLPPATLDEKLADARVARAAGRADASKRLCVEIVSAARVAGDRERLARAALQLLADVRPGVIDRSEVALLEEARAAFGDDGGALACQVLARLSCALLPTSDATEALRIGAEAVRRARALGDEEALRAVLELSGWASYFYGPPQEHVPLTVELLDRALAGGDLPRALTAYTRLAGIHVSAGDFEAFDRDVDAMLVLSDRLGHPRYRWQPLLFASMRATARGHFAESDRFVTEVEQLATLADDPALPLSLACHLAMRGRVLRRDAQQEAALARHDAATEGMWQSALFRGAIRAAAAARMEDADAARAALASIATSVRAFDGEPVLAALLGEAYALAGTDDDRRRYHELLARTTRRDLFDGVPVMHEGSVVRVLGLLDAALGDLASAEARLREALAQSRARQHAPWIAQIAWELAKVLRAAKREDEARGLVEESVRIARELGMTGLVERAGGAASPEEPRAAGVTMERAGGAWRVARGAIVATVKDSRGMQLLARLVERPDEEIHVLALASDEGASVPESSAGELLDDRARAAYRARLAELDEDLAEAECAADPGRVAKHRREKEALLAELARAVGLGGRARQAGSATERARVNVQRRVKDAIARIGEADEALGRYFERAVRTGTFCCFRP